jgi:hypothetical protein
MTRPAAALVLWAGLTAATPCLASQLPSVLPARGFDARKTDEGGLELPSEDAARLRLDALARAAVFRPDESAASPARLDRQPEDLFGQQDELVCKFLPEKIGGTVPKFECVFEDGSVLKVKYNDRETYTEVAATRLLEALGAGADRVYFVSRLRCFGCPSDPFTVLSCLSSPFPARRQQCAPLFGVKRAKDGSRTLDVNYGSYVDFTNVSVERRLPGRAIKTGESSGWSWGELDRLEGSQAIRRQRRTERDALRLVAVLLDDWDTHSENQRLVCLDKRPAPAAGCREPFAYLHDVGATFGGMGGGGVGLKLDVERWSAAPVWKDEASCLVAIQSPRMHGATFGEATISEAGRQFLARRLARIGREQVREMFEAARFTSYQGGRPAGRDVSRWVDAFEDKVRRISERSPCPTP